MLKIDAILTVSIIQRINRTSIKVLLRLKVMASSSCKSGDGRIINKLENNETFRNKSSYKNVVIVLSKICQIMYVNNYEKHYEVFINE